MHFISTLLPIWFVSAYDQWMSSGIDVSPLHRSWNVEILRKILSHLHSPEEK